MKYMLLVYGDEGLWTEEERRRCMQESAALCRELAGKGQYLAASPLHSVATATSLRWKEGRPLVTDGPFAETHEQLGGYYVIDVPDLDEAMAVAARIPALKKGTVEIRPIFELDELPEAGRADAAGQK